MLAFNTLNGATALPGPIAPPDSLSGALLAVRSLIVDAGIGFTPNAVAVSLLSRPRLPCAAPFCTVRWGGAAFDQPFNLGGGRWECVAEQTIEVRVVTRISRDETQKHLQFLTGRDSGNLPIVWDIVNALTEKFLVDPRTGLRVSTVGMKPASVGAAEPYGDDPALGIIPITFRARVDLNLTVPDP